MPLNKVGLDLNGLGSVEPIEFNISNGTKEFIESIPEKSNEITGGHLGGIILFFVAFYLYYKLNNMDYSGVFKYSSLRSLAISTGICGVIGVCMLSVGYFTRVYPVALLVGLFMIAFILTKLEER